MPGTPIPFVKPQWFKDDGTPAAGYQLFVYDAGTSTKQNTWSDEALTSLNTNPIILDSSGRASVFLSAQTHKFVLANDTAADPPAGGDTIWTEDEVASIPFYTVSQTVNPFGTEVEWVRTDATLKLTSPYSPIVVSNYYVDSAITSAAVVLPAAILYETILGTVGSLVIEWEVDHTLDTLEARCTMFGSDQDLGCGVDSDLTRARYVVSPVDSATVSISQTVWQQTTVPAGTKAQVAMARTTIGSLDLVNTDYSVATLMASGTFTIRGSRIYFVRDVANLLG